MAVGVEQDLEITPNRQERRAKMLARIRSVSADIALAMFLTTGREGYKIAHDAVHSGDELPQD